MAGILYGIGVGPGASDLLTLRAVAVLKTIDCLVMPLRVGSDISRAFEIARPHLPPDVEQLILDFPMTKDRARLREAWDIAAEKTCAALSEGKRLAFVTIGDPLVYSTFTYLMRTVAEKDPNVRIVVVPGITSFQAAACALKIPLCEGAEHLHILSGIADKESLVNELRHADTAVILKAYRNMTAIRDALAETGRERGIWQVTSVECEGERMGNELGGQEPPYMTLLISRKPRGEEPPAG